MFKNLQKKNSYKNIPISYPPPPAPPPPPPTHPKKNKIIGFQLNSDPHLIQKGKNRKKITSSTLNIARHNADKHSCFKLMTVLDHCHSFNYFLLMVRFIHIVISEIGEWEHFCIVPVKPFRIDVSRSVCMNSYNYYKFRLGSRTSTILLGTAVPGCSSRHLC